MILLSESRFSQKQNRDESAQSILRSIRRGGRPGAPASCSRYERSLDTLSSCVASSRVESPTSSLPPPWPLLSLCCGSDVNTLCEIPDRSALRSALLPPATFAKTSCLVC